MTTEQKKQEIKRLVNDMLTESFEAMKKNIDKILNSGAIDVDTWEAETAPMILPKCILTAILKHESHQYEGKGTSFEKYVKKESNNIQLFL